MANLTHTVSGNVASFRSAARAPIESLKCHFIPKQEGTGDPSPENTREIKGWSGLTLKRTGKNIIDFYHRKEDLRPSAYYNGYSGWCDEIKIDDALRGKTVIYSAYIDATNVTNGETNKCAVWGKMKDGSWEYLGKWGTQIQAGQKGTSYVSVQITNNTNWIAFGLSIQPECVAYNPMVEISNSLTEYEKYNEYFLPVTFPAFGKNLFNKEFFSDFNNYPNSGAYSYQYSNGVLLKPNTQYIMWPTNGSRLNTEKYYVLRVGSYVDGVVSYPVANGYPQTITFTTNSNGIVFFGTFSDSLAEFMSINWQLEEGSVATSFESYTNTFYGGYVDIIKGEVIAEYGIYTTTWGSLGEPEILGETERRAYSCPLTFEDASVLHANGQGPFLKKATTMCNIARWKWDYFHDSVHYYINNKYICLMLPINTNDATVVQFCALLKEPLHFSLPNIELKTYLDQNNVWSDANDITEVLYAIHDSADMLASKKRIMTNEPHLVEASGSLVTFETDIVAPIEIIGQGNITITGKNMLNPANLLDPNPYTSEGITFSMDSDGVVTVNGVAGDTTSPQYRFVWDLPFSANCYFCANAPYSGTYTETYAYNVTLGKRFTKWDGVTNGQSSSSTRVLSEAHLIEGYKCGIHIRISRGSGKEFINDKFYPMLLPGSCTDSTFEPYKGITLPAGSLFKSFKGINNIWSDNGNVTVRYWTYKEKQREIAATWNQIVPEINSTNYVPQNDEYGNLSFDNNEITINLIQDTQQVFHTSARSSSFVAYDPTHQYYVSEEIWASQSGEYIAVLGSRWLRTNTTVGNEWQRLSWIGVPDRDYGYVYLGYCAGQRQIGYLCKVRNPICIDLTLMFGAGNEPTLENFERQCELNNVDLAAYYPIDTGSSRMWKL